MTTSRTLRGVGASARASATNATTPLAIRTRDFMLASRRRSGRKREPRSHAAGRSLLFHFGEKLPEVLAQLLGQRRPVERVAAVDAEVTERVPAEEIAIIVREDRLAERLLVVREELRADEEGGR